MKTIIFYEEKLLRRNWLFYFFILGVLGYIVGVLIPWNAKQVLWSDVALASSVFSRGISFLNLFQSVIVVFLVCDIQRKRNKAETFYPSRWEWTFFSWRILWYFLTVPCGGCCFHDCLRDDPYSRA